MLAPLRETALRSAARRRAHAIELYERALLAHDRARSCLLRARGLLRQASQFVDQGPLTSLSSETLDWLP